MKKIFLGLGALALAVALVPMFAAFEAHVINVTAQIENALSVPLDSIDFGTVFPQEHLDKPLAISLSKSFIDEDRVDDVEYIIRQKPKCGWTNEDGTNLYGIPTATGHVVVNPQTGATSIECPDPGNPLRPIGAVYGVLPSLCEYISKEGEDNNDGTLPSFHKPYIVVLNDKGTTDLFDDYYELVWTDTHGRLAKSENDEVDNWNIDLAVPCFGGYCAQDWESFVLGINPNATNTDDYIQPIANEHKVFGCDLWVEVTEVSEVSEMENGG